MTNYSRPRSGMIARLASLSDASDPAVSRVLEAMSSIPRHMFVEPPLRHRAYSDCSLPIGRGQTLSQPMTVLSCLAAVDPGESDTMLEVGSGSGYLAAVAGRLCSRVTGVETMLELVHRSRNVIEELGLTNVLIQYGDGGAGWPSAAPYDCIIVSAAADAVHPGLFSQLSEGGRLGAPVSGDGGQSFRFFRKKDGRMEEYRAGFACRFVPLTGRFGSIE
ncbi:MAG TPA: protein-L-isoaspartate O-methyltransferase [Candidatus Fermentibacter daniensis]|nr:MAG: hypothetical protein AO396_06945 [Candidatus Fermentibacter daniensis]MBP7719735.1 protein-L-isoaspartate O-methyltransferase [Candidatus Fermentibacter sp.]KZD15971.1 MAG: hypothetical protein AO395_05095 [Candidatus Fermentibacter daniensis]KZD16339.1 MAG: hypothetical protein AO394_07055 [Candidatus Fermentibacter daniensis]MCC6871083.1 protein-L-isoaspartate O-methyltransferase [Candidatus Fermentibacter sp.]